VTMVNVTRVWNSICAVSFMRRSLSLARDYAARRLAFGVAVAEQPLHIDTLAGLDVDLRGCSQLVMEVVRLMGRVECNTATQEEHLLFRLLTPVTKLYTGRRAVAAVAEGMEAVGGQGYIEDSGIPTLLRDTHVLPVWEGTTNVLSLDVLRAIRSSNGEAFNVFCSAVTSRLARTTGNERLAHHVTQVNLALQALKSFVQAGGLSNEHVAREVSFSIARVMIALLLLEQCSWPHTTGSDLATLSWFMLAQPLVPALPALVDRLPWARDIIGHVTKVQGDQYRPYGPAYRSQL